MFRILCFVVARTLLRLGRCSRSWRTSRGCSPDPSNLSARALKARPAWSRSPASLPGKFRRWTRRSRACRSRTCRNSSPPDSSRHSTRSRRNTNRRPVSRTCERTERTRPGPSRGGWSKSKSFSYGHSKSLFVTVPTGLTGGTLLLPPHRNRPPNAGRADGPGPTEAPISDGMRRYQMRRTTVRIRKSVCGG